MTKKRKIVLIILSVVAALLTVFGVKMYLFFTAKPHIAVNYVAEWNKISKPENYDPNKNAYFDYEGAAAYIAEYPQIMNEESWPNWPGDMNEAQLKILKDWLNDNSKALEYFKKGAKKPYYWQQADTQAKTWQIVLPMLAPMRRCTQAACWRAKLNAFENKTDEAMEDILTCYRAGILMSGEKRTLVEHLVGSALRSLAAYTGLSILSNSDVAPDKLANCQKHLEELISKRPAKIDFTGEKIFIYDIIQHIFTDDGNGNGRMIPREAGKLMNIFRGNVYGLRSKPQPRSFFDIIDSLFSRTTGNSSYNINSLHIVLMGPDRKQHIEAAERVYKFFEDIQAKSLGQIHSQGINLEKQINDILANYQLLKVMASSLLIAIEINHRQTASEEALLTVISSLRFKAEKGEYPESVQELVATGYLKELPMDPYRDGPLTYKKTEDGFILYSFGADFDDDGGTHSDWGKGKSGGDRVFWPVVKDEKK